MKVYFNGLGVVTGVDTTGDSLRQGSVNVSLEAIFNGIDNSYYSAKFDFTRNDGSRISGVVMQWDAEDGEAFRYSFGDAWFFAKSGQTSLTIYLYDSEGTVTAQGQVQFSIEETDYGDEPTITVNQFNSLMTALASKIGMPSSSLRVDELPETGDVGVFYVVHDDDNDPTRANIYVWNRDTEAYLWVGSNELDLNKYYTKEEGGAFEETVNRRVTSVENELESVASGSPKGVFGTLADLRNAYPSGDSGIYVVLEDGKWYYWNGSAWTAGGQYLESGIGKDVELLNRINLVNLLSQGKYDSLIQGSYVNAFGNEIQNADYQEYVYNSPRFRYIKIGGYGTSTVSAIAFYSSEQRNAITLISVVPYPIRDGDSIYEKYAEVPSTCRCVVFSTKKDKDGVYAYGPAYDYLYETFISKSDGGELEEGVISSDNDELGQKVYFGNGRIAVQDTDDGAFTYYDMGSITNDSSKYYLPRHTENGGRFITDKWSGFSDYLPLSGGTMTGGIVSEGTGRKATFGDGVLTLEDTVYGRKTEIGKYAINVDGGNFYYPPAAEAGGTLVTDKWTGFDKYAKKTDLEEYAKKTDLNGYATKKDFDDLKSIVYGIHSLTYNSYEFPYLTSSIIPDEVDGRKTVGGSYAIADWVGGNSFVYNQIIKGYRGTQTINGVTFTNQNNLIIVNGTATADTRYDIGYTQTPQHFSPAPIIGHKYLLISCPKGGSTSTYYSELNTFGNDIGNGILNTWTTASDQGVTIKIKSGQVMNNVVFFLNVYDLTASGIDFVTTVDEAKAELLKRGVNVDEYNEYNAGEIKSTIVSKIESWGYNLFDGEWEQGRYDLNTGLPVVGYAGYYRSKNKIKVVGGKTYTISRTENTLGYLYEYDKDNNFLGNTYIPTNTTNDFVLKQKTAYINISLGFSLTSEPTNTCVHLTGSRTGYAPYVGKLGQINIPNAPLGLDGVNDIHDLLTFEEQSDGTYNAILTRKFRTYRFTGNETIEKLPQYGENFMGCDIGNLGFKNETAPLFNKGVFKKGTISDLPVGSCYLYGRNLYYNIGTNDEQANRDFVNGLKMYFQLATPTSEVIATGLTFEQVSFLTEKGGTIKAVYEEVPPTASVDFMTKGE